MRLDFKAVKSAWRGLKEFRKSISKETLAQERLNAKNFVDSISDEKWNKMSQSIFNQSGEGKSKAVETLSELRSYFKSQGIDMPYDVEQAFSHLERKANVFADRMNAAVAKGKNPEYYYDYGTKFYKSNKSQFDTVNNFLDSATNKMTSKVYDAIGNNELYKQCVENQNKMWHLRIEFDNIRYYNGGLFNMKISKVNPEILPKDNIYYHGTKQGKSITKNGFSLVPKRMQAKMGSRELGQGVYLTPDRVVASRYAGVSGNILKLKVDTGKVAAVNSEQLENIARTIGKEVGSVESAEMELILKNLFERNGYNAAYSRQALGTGLFNQKELVDMLAGGKQSQLVVFNPENINIIGKSVSERVKNSALQFKTFINTPINIIKYIKWQNS